MLAVRESCHRRFTEREALWHDQRSLASTLPEDALIYSVCLVAVAIAIHIARIRCLMTSSADRNGVGRRGPVCTTDAAAGVLCCSTGTGTGADMPIAAILIELFLSVPTIDTLRMSMIRRRQYERIVIPAPRWIPRRLESPLHGSSEHCF